MGVCQPAKAPEGLSTRQKGMAAIHTPSGNDFSNAYNLKHANERLVQYE